MSEQPAIQYAELLRQLRAERGLTQEELASAAGISPRTISDLERGINLTPRKATAELLADALRLPEPEREQFMAAARRRPVTTPAAVLAAGRRRCRPGADSDPAVEAGRPAGAGAGAGTPPGGVAGREDDADASNVVWIESAASAAFVDREEELGVLREAWSSARAGRRVLTLIAGEPGIGKTALTAELARLVRADGGLVLYGRWDEHVPAPYQAFREALNDYARACPDALLRRDLAGLAEEIARLCPEPARRVGASAAPQAAAQAERFRLFESIDTWIGRIAARHPVLLVLDDLQWADQPSFFLLPHLMRARRSTPLLTVAMYRDLGPERSEFAAALPSLTRDIDCRRVSLRGLEHRAVTTLLEDAVGRPFGERESGMVAELEWETAGNPFFLLEMARHLSEVGAFDRDVVRLGETPAEIPQSIRDMVRSRLRRLPAGCAETLAVAALIGERFDAGLLASAASLTDAATVDLLEEAARAGLIAEIDDEPDHWRFSHSLTRRVTSEELSRGRRAVLHQRIGETLEFRPGVAAAELAHHFGAAGNQGSAQKAVRYGHLAGKRALQEVAAEVAVRHFRRALELLDRFGPENQALRCELLLDLAGAHDRAGEYAYRDERFAEAADTARRLGSDELFARAALGYGGVLPAASVPTCGRKRSSKRRSSAWMTRTTGPGRRSWPGSPTGCTTCAPTRSGWSSATVPSPSPARTQDRRTLATVLLHRCWALDGPGDVSDSAHGGGRDPQDRGRARRPRADPRGAAHPARRAVRERQPLRRRADGRGDEDAGGGGAATRSSSGWPRCGTSSPPSLRAGSAEAEELAGELGRRLDQIGHSQAQLISVAQSASWRLLQGHATEYIAPFEAMSAADPGNLAYPAITAWCLAEAGARDRAAELLAPDRSGLGGGRGQELPVVGGDRRFLRRGRPGRRPALGAGAVRSRRSLRREQLHAGAGELPRRGRPLAGRARDRGRPLHRGQRAPGGRAGQAPRDGRAAVDGADRGGLRPGAVAARPARRRRAGGRAHRVRDAHRRGARAGRDHQPAACGLTRLTGTDAADGRPLPDGADASDGASADRGSSRSSGTRRRRPWLPTIASRWA